MMKKKKDIKEQRSRYSFLQKKNVRYGSKVRDNFVIDIFLKLFDQFQQINSYFKEPFKVFL